MNTRHISSPDNHIYAETRREIFNIYTKSAIYSRNQNVIDRFIYPPGDWSADELDMITRGRILQLNMADTQRQMDYEFDPQELAGLQIRHNLLKNTYERLREEFIANE